MVNKNNENTVQDDSEITYDNPETIETELVEEEANAEQKLKALRKKLEEATEKNRELQEETQRIKADFLNARKRLEEEQILDRKRSTIKAIEKILPLADSFYLAMLDKKAWEAADATWRKGVEGIFNQLQSILRSYQVAAIDPTGQVFDPQKHEAMSSIPVENETKHNVVLTVMQLGYIQNDNDTEIVIRPARVTVGEYTA